MTAVDEAVDTSAADQAWWDMQVPCQGASMDPTCSIPAAWVSVNEHNCGCVLLRCDAHKQMVDAQRRVLADMGVPSKCRLCGRVTFDPPPPLDWRRL